MNCVYIRISTIGQNEAGQRAEIDKWLAGNGIADAAYYVDKDTGDNLDRPDSSACNPTSSLAGQDGIVGS